MEGLTITGAVTGLPGGGVLPDSADPFAGAGGLACGAGFGVGTGGIGSGVIFRAKSETISWLSETLAFY